jgi:hypothetical protein
MASSWKELGYTGSVETGLGKTKSGSQARSTGTNDNRIIFVILQYLSIKCPGGISGVTYDDGVFTANKM